MTGPDADGPVTRRPHSATGPDWSPATYLRFGDERERPARDLLARVPLAEARAVVDLGCGPGNSTRLLRERFPQADLLGLDSSPAMIATARESAPDCRFALADAATWRPDADVDLVYANALFQWLPDRMDILAGLIEAMTPGGVLAVQMPDNLAEPSHRLMSETATGFNEKLAGAQRDPLAEPAAYFERLSPFAAQLDVWRTTYIHPLAGPGAIVEMFSSTGLRPFLAPLSEDERARFLREYTAAIASAYPPLPDGRVLLRFPRLFLVAVRS